MEWNVENILIWVKTELKNMQQSFQAGVDTIYNAVVARDVTPASKSPEDIAAAIAEISGSDLIPVILAGVVQDGFEIVANGNAVVSQGDGYVDIETHASTASIACTVNAVMAKALTVNAQYAAIKISDSTNYSTTTNTASSQPLSVTEDPVLISVGSVGNTETNIVFSGGANGHLKIYDLYIYNWEEE